MNMLFVTLHHKHSALYSGEGTAHEIATVQKELIGKCIAIAL